MMPIYVKLFNIILNTGTYAEQYNTIHETQAGFHKNHLTLYNILY